MLLTRGKLLSTRCAPFAALDIPALYQLHIFQALSFSYAVLFYMQQTFLHLIQIILIDMYMSIAIACAAHICIERQPYNSDTRQNNRKQEI